MDLDEFGGAIVPDTVDATTLKQLEDHGIRVETYSDADSRLAARGKFEDFMFTAGPFIGLPATAVLAAMYAESGEPNVQ